MPKRTKILTYKELVSIPLGENKEPLVDVRSYDSSIIAQYTEQGRKDMFPYTQERIFVRETVARKLARANKALKNMVIFGSRLFMDIDIRMSKKNILRKNVLNLENCIPLFLTKS